MKREGRMRAQSFDALELADTGGVITGEIDPATLPRLADRLAAPEPGSRAFIAWRLSGEHDALGRPAMALSLDGKVFLVCQRCLSPFAVRVAQETTLLLARDEPELALLDNAEPEVVLANAPVDPVALVEDELLLSLPFSPRHEECVPAEDRSSRVETPSPFARLAKLKTGRTSRK